jgi:hypothetical protein
LAQTIASSILLWIFEFALPPSGIGIEIVTAVITSVVGAATFGLYYMYSNTSVAAFYERAGGLLLAMPLSGGDSNPIA